MRVAWIRECTRARVTLDIERHDPERREIVARERRDELPVRRPKVDGARRLEVGLAETRVDPARRGAPRDVHEAQDRVYIRLVNLAPGQLWVPSVLDAPSAVPQAFVALELETQKAGQGTILKAPKIPAVLDLARDEVSVKRSLDGVFEIPVSFQVKIRIEARPE